MTSFPAHIHYMKNNEIAMFPVIVRSIIKSINKKVLLLKVAEGNPQEGLWELPGGYIKEYETLELAMQRINHEQTGLITKNIGKKYYGLADSFLNYAEDVQKVEIAADSYVLASQVRITKLHDEYRWVDLEAIFEYDLTFGSKQALIKHYEDVEKLNRLDEPDARPVIIAGRGLIQKDNKYLFLKRHELNSYPNKWELPGGKLNVLEKIDDAIIRELFEETSLLVEVTKLVEHLDSKVHDRGGYKGYTFVNIVSKTKISSGKLKLTHKHSEYKWCTRKDILKLDLAPYMEKQIANLFLKK